MNTITIWLLVSLGAASYQQPKPYVTVERFTTSEECLRVAAVLRGDDFNRPLLQCVQATVYKP